MLQKCEDGKHGFPSLMTWLTDEELHSNIIKLEHEGRFRNERTVQAYIWTWLENKILEARFRRGYQLDVELYGDEKRYPDLTLCRSMSMEDYFTKKNKGIFKEDILVWVELKFHPHATSTEGVIEDNLLDDLDKCNKHSSRSNEGYRYDSYLILVCSGPGTFGELVDRLEKGASEYTTIIPIYTQG